MTTNFKLALIVTYTKGKKDKLTITHALESAIAGFNQLDGNSNHQAFVKAGWQVADYKWGQA